MVGSRGAYVQGGGAWGQRCVRLATGFVRMCTMHPMLTALPWDARAMQQVASWQQIGSSDIACNEEPPQALAATS